MTRKDRNYIFAWASLICILLFTPRLCAQAAEIRTENAVEMRTTFVDYGKKYIGCPYVSGATGPNSFDCSGFVYAVSRESIGVQLPRTVKNMYNFCTIIRESEREAGDLVFFNTTSSSAPSHVGIYIGNGQFLNCASDGPNTGVILSSLNEGYWKGKYTATGRFLPASDSEELADRTQNNDATVSHGSTQSGSNGGTQRTTSAASRNSSNSFLDNISFEGFFAAAWSFFTPDYFRLNFRGVDAEISAKYCASKIQPGFGAVFRWDAGTDNFQIPLIFSVCVNEWFRIYAGPVISLGTPMLSGNSGEEVKASFFPGILGMNWNTPAIEAGGFSICFSQDIHYTVFNKMNGSALPFLKNLANGIALSSGIRVTLPLKNLLK